MIFFIIISFLIVYKIKLFVDFIVLVNFSSSLCLFVSKRKELCFTFAEIMIANICRTQGLLFCFICILCVCGCLGVFLYFSLTEIKKRDRKIIENYVFSILMCRSGTWTCGQFKEGTSTKQVCSFFGS